MLSKNNSLKINPSEKEAYVKSLFSEIAPKYDFINSILSLSLHSKWRKYAVKCCELKQGSIALDVCCGTGDFSFELKRAVGIDGVVYGVDNAEPMLQIAKGKSERLSLKIDLIVANAESIPLDSNICDAATVGFGLRNVTDVNKALTQMVRIVKPGGRVVSLEIGRVELLLLKQLWNWYFCKLGPLLARLLGGKQEAYEYLPLSVMEFLSPVELAQVFSDCGLKNVEYKKLCFGAVMIHIGVK